MYLRYGVVLLVAAVLCVGATNAESEVEEVLHREERSIPQTSNPRPGPRPHPSPTFPKPPRGQTRFRREIAEVEGVLHREERSIPQTSNPRPGPRPHPSPTFPKPPRGQPRFRREIAEVDGEISSRYGSNLQPYPDPSGMRFKRERGGGSVAVDVDRTRGSKTTTRVTAEQNIYKSGDGRTRVDASGYATNRGDRGGMINFSHRFP